MTSRIAEGVETMEHQQHHHEHFYVDDRLGVHLQGNSYVVLGAEEQEEEDSTKAGDDATPVTRKDASDAGHQCAEYHSWKSSFGPPQKTRSLRRAGPSCRLLFTDEIVFETMLRMTNILQASFHDPAHFYNCHQRKQAPTPGKSYGGAGGASSVPVSLSKTTSSGGGCMSTTFGSEDVMSNVDREDQVGGAGERKLQLTFTVPDEQHEVHFPPQDDCILNAENYHRVVLRKLEMWAADLDSSTIADDGLSSTLSTSSAAISASSSRNGDGGLFHQMRLDDFLTSDEDHFQAAMLRTRTRPTRSKKINEDECQCWGAETVFKGTSRLDSSVPLSNASCVSKRNLLDYLFPSETTSSPELDTRALAQKLAKVEAMRRKELGARRGPIGEVSRTSSLVSSQDEAERKGALMLPPVPAGYEPVASDMAIGHSCVAIGHGDAGDPSRRVRNELVSAASRFPKRTGLRKLRRTP
eukprot:CAMPEP_0178986328 /NCGR_PEP_ID=MMETSP0795-20121207/2646_1 /TAXON_ID=88552 /ORGANISM="Amoebophrya sp., Strain Ameob2" /LENGTH=467 /DNA_ID=CAMNT_0020677383 /DNA_START=274 /DNA_END=1676 /DNA_ORIENTATION=+